MERRPRVIVVGGGVSGLATACQLHRHGGAEHVTVTLIEADDVLGGKIRTATVDQRPVDLGPDSILVRAPGVRESLGTLGLADMLVAPGASFASILSRGRLRTMPSGTVFGVPEKLLPLLRSGLLSPLGMVRAAADLVLPQRHLGSDPSVADLIRPRFGDELFDRLIEPLLGGVHAGQASRLSAASTLPEITAVARQNRSLYLGLRRRGRNTDRGGAGHPAGGPALMSLDGGISRLVDALAAQLPREELRTGTAAVSVSRRPDGRLTVQLADGSALESDAVVLATPTYITAELLSSLVPTAAEALREIRYADVASVILAYPAQAVPQPLRGTGFLVPPEEQRFIVGCTWLSQKWPHLAGGPHILIRCLVGRYGDTQPIPARDDELLNAVHAELSEILSLRGRPAEVRVQRWPGALPQYTVGHAGRLDRIEAALRDVAGLHVTGAGYHGMGIASCLTRGDLTARTVLDHLSNPLVATAATPATKTGTGTGTGTAPTTAAATGTAPTTAATADTAPRTAAATVDRGTGS